jgi:hypothetical protein
MACGWVPAVASCRCASCRCACRRAATHCHVITCVQGFFVLDGVSAQRITLHVTQVGVLIWLRMCMFKRIALQHYCAGSC